MKFQGKGFIWLLEYHNYCQTCYNMKSNRNRFTSGFDGQNTIEKTFWKGLFIELHLLERIKIWTIFVLNPPTPSKQVKISSLKLILEYYFFIRDIYTSFLTEHTKKYSGLSLIAITIAMLKEKLITVNSHWELLRVLRDIHHFLIC